MAQEVRRGAESRRQNHRQVAAQINLSPVHRATNRRTRLFQRLVQHPALRPALEDDRQSRIAFDPPADQSVSTFRTCNHPVAIDCQGVAEAIAQLLAAVAQRLRLSACLGAQWKGTDQAAAGQTLGAESWEPANT